MSLSPTSIHSFSQSNPPNTAPMQIRMLLPEDEPMTKGILATALPRFLQRNFPDEQFILYPANNLAEAVDILDVQHQKAEDIDVVLTDNDMDSANEGVKLVYRIASSASTNDEMPLTVMNSATDIGNTLGNTIRSLGGHFFLKPIRLQNFMNLLQANMPQIRQRQANPNQFNINHSQRQLPTTLDELLADLREAQCAAAQSATKPQKHAALSTETLSSNEPTEQSEIPSSADPAKENQSNSDEAAFRLPIAEQSVSEFCQLA